MSEIPQNETPLEKQYIHEVKDSSDVKTDPLLEQKKSNIIHSLPDIDVQALDNCLVGINSSQQLTEVANMAMNLKFAELRLGIKIDSVGTERLNNLLRAGALSKVEHRIAEYGQHIPNMIDHTNMQSDIQKTVIAYAKEFRDISITDSMEGTGTVFLAGHLIIKDDDGKVVHEQSYINPL